MRTYGALGGYSLRFALRFQTACKTFRSAARDWNFKVCASCHRRRCLRKRANPSETRARKVTGLRGTSPYDSGTTRVADAIRSQRYCGRGSSSLRGCVPHCGLRPPSSESRPAIVDRCSISWRSFMFTKQDVSLAAVALASLVVCGTAAAAQSDSLLTISATLTSACAVCCAGVAAQRPGGG